jgi:uncharacterized membrane protein
MRNPMVLFLMSFFVLALSVSILFLERVLGMELTDYSLIVWDFAVSTIVVLVTVTVVKYGKRKKKKKKKKPEAYSKPEEQYRTEYY